MSAPEIDFKSVCTWFRHDFGLLEPIERAEMLLTAEEWLVAFEKEGAVLINTPEALAAAPEVQRLIAEAVAREREACAAHLESVISGEPGTMGFMMGKVFAEQAAAIRNRKETT